MSRLLPVTALALAITLSVGSVDQAAAQSSDSGGMTAEQMMQAFEKQKTRGLVLVPSESTAPAVTATEPTTTVTTAATTYTEVDKADQVNIKITFDFDSASLRDDQKPQLATLCEVMKAVDVQLFQIVGHTDSSGSASYNQNLSLLRAKEVKRHLVTECGIPETRLEAIGMGENAPFNADDPRSDENRRVEFQALG